MFPNGFQHSQTLSATVLAQGSLNTSGTVTNATVTTPLPPNAIVLYQIFSAVNANGESGYTVTFAGSSGTLLADLGPSSVDTSDAFNMIWGVRKIPAGILSNSWTVTVTHTSGASSNGTYFMLFYIQNAINYVGYQIGSRSVNSSTTYAVDYQPLAGVSITPLVEQFKKNQLIFYTTGNNDAVTVSSYSNRIQTPAGDAWTSVLRAVNAGVVGVNVLYAYFPFISSAGTGFQYVPSGTAQNIELWHRFN